MEETGSHLSSAAIMEIIRNSEAASLSGSWRGDVLEKTEKAGGWGPGANMRANGHERK